jgi:hypothetical protein
MYSGLVRSLFPISLRCSKRRWKYGVIKQTLLLALPVALLDHRCIPLALSTFTLGSNLCEDEFQTERHLAACWSR